MMCLDGDLDVSEMFLCAQNAGAIENDEMSLTVLDQFASIS